MSFQYYFVPQALYKIQSSTSLHCKTRAKYFTILSCTARLAQGTSQYHFVLPSITKHVPVLVTSLYYKAYTKYLPVSQPLKQKILYTSRFALCTSHSMLHTPRLHTSHSTLHIFTCSHLHTPLCTLHIPRPTTSHFTLHTSHFHIFTFSHVHIFTLHSAHFISSHSPVETLHSTLHIFSSSHLHTPHYASSHSTLHIITSSHSTSSNLTLHTAHFTSSHLQNNA